MKTQIVTVDPDAPDSTLIDTAARLIRAGRVVAFPTETVYGLGANALDPAAVRIIFEVKERPVENPLIVHVRDISQIVNVASVWPETANRLAGRFWPGPLTIVVPRGPEVPDEVTAGGNTVAIRCPAHPVARAIIGSAGVPIAAPSANRSTEVSPTRAEHVLESLDGRIDMILDGGPCPGGIESTVVDVSDGVARLLRPGLITLPMLEAVIGTVEIGPASKGVARSPGQMAKHYSPRTPLRLSPRVLEYVRSKKESGDRLGVMTFTPGLDSAMRTVPGVIRAIDLTSGPTRAAALLYEALHELDRLGLGQIVVEEPPDTPDWAGIRDRLTRAAAT
jgi:L-threonylcarbamoyladenylate synthase